ncbi:MAG TPA: HEAT repeat domain-containing protein [Tepidisphaeraceae bacterium]|jgi:HEAT repeat protein
MLDRILTALVESKNEAADDVLLEALRIGNEQEKTVALSGLLRRATLRGLSGAIAQSSTLPDSLQESLLQNIRTLHHALRECGRSDDRALRISALRLIALGRQGKLAYVLSENLNHTDEELSKPAVEAIVALCRWVASESRNLQKLPDEERGKLYQQLTEQRPEIEQAVARAMDVHRGKHGQELLRAGLLLCDWPESKTLAILRTAKHGGQSPMVRRLQQPPASEHVEAFLLGASHGGLRSHFGIVFSHIDEAPVLDAVLRKTHWLKDHQLQLCMHQVSRGTWWGDSEMIHDIERRTPADSARIGEWLAVSGMHDVVQDERMERLREHAADDFASRLRLLRIAMRRPRGASVNLIRSFLSDPDERLMRMAAREIVRRRPVDFENMLLQLMTNAPDSVRRVVSRSLGQAGFEHFWQRFDRMDKSTRKAAGRAMMKILPDAAARLSKRLLAGPIEQRVKAMQITQELNLGESLTDTLVLLCTDPNPKLRSKAISVLGGVDGVSEQVLLDRVLQDSDARVRANAIEVLESRPRHEYLPLLAQRARAANNRERANAIKALHKMKVGAFSEQLTNMLRDNRPEHRISALWVLRHVGWWQLLQEVGKLAKADENLRVRRYALGILRTVAEQINLEKAKAS